MDLSEHVVHTAILEDSFNLVRFSDGILPEFRDLCEKYRGFGALGCTTISGDQFSFRLLEECRAAWPDRQPGDGIESKLAYVLGWVSHRATDRQMKPIWTEPDPMGKGYDADPALSPTECSVYHEGFMFREYYMEHERFRDAILPGGLDALAGPLGIDAAQAAPFVQTLLLRNLFEEQTLVRDPTDVNKWFERVGLRRQRFYVDLNRYVRAILTPDPAKLDEFVVSIRFFDRNDAILRMARAIRDGAEPTSTDIEAAVAAEPESHYGKALRLSYGYIRAASDYYATDMPFEELKERLDIGKRGRDGRVV
ncbi:MAG: hypothetical protein KBA30_02475 [Clostridia bacterium]|nr:hypothetical protein [Clostridia bacterium]